MKNLAFSIFVFFFIAQNSIAQSEWVEVRVNEIPDTVVNVVKKDYNKYAVNETTKKENESGEILFRFEIQKKNTVYHLVFNADAKLISKTKSKSFTFDGDDMKKKKKSSGGGNNDIMPPRMPNF